MALGMETAEQQATIFALLMKPKIGDTVLQTNTQPATLRPAKKITPVANTVKATTGAIRWVDPGTTAALLQELEMESGIMTRMDLFAKVRHSKMFNV